MSETTPTSSCRLKENPLQTLVLPHPNQLILADRDPLISTKPEEDVLTTEVPLLTPQTDPLTIYLPIVLTSPISQEVLPAQMLTGQA